MKDYNADVEETFLLLKTKRKENFKVCQFVNEKLL